MAAQAPFGSVPGTRLAVRLQRVIILPDHQKGAGPGVVPWANPRTLFFEGF
jgi:hypothetical protein